MTPDEHYHQAERLLAAAATAYDKDLPSWQLEAQLAQVHATLATCGTRDDRDRA